MNDRALPAADELAIRNLLARYVHFADAGELDAFASLFTEDGSWTRENTPPASQGGSGLPAHWVNHVVISRFLGTSIPRVGEATNPADKSRNGRMPTC